MKQAKNMMIALVVSLICGAMGANKLLKLATLDSGKTKVSGKDGSSKESGATCAG